LSVDLCEASLTSFYSRSAFLTPATRGMEAGWIAYRNVRKRYDANKVTVMGLRYIMAAAYLPGNLSSFPGLPTNMTPHHAVNYAISRASTPADMMAFLVQDNIAVQMVWEWGGHRGNISEQLLVAFAELERVVLGSDNPEGGCLVPLHESIVLAVESAKILMEMEAGRIMLRRSASTSNRAFRLFNWFFALQQVSASLRRIAMLVPEDPDGESIANGCSNLTGSMIRVADGWVQMAKKEGGDNDFGGDGPFGGDYGARTRPRASDQRYRSSRRKRPIRCWDWSQWTRLRWPSTASAAIHGFVG
jgi:hypothetical protein